MLISSVRPWHGLFWAQLEGVVLMVTYPPCAYFNSLKNSTFLPDRNFTFCGFTILSMLYSKIILNLVIPNYLDIL